MALLSIFRGTQAECSARPVSDGTLLFATDTKKIYLDKDSSRIEMSSVDDLSDYVTKEQLTTALNGKANTTHTHTQDQITGLKDALAGKASTSHSHSVASSSASGFMSAADKQKLDGIAAGANKYTLPVASSTVLGGMKIGYKESGKNYSVKLDDNNQAYVTVPWTVPDGSVTTDKLADGAVTLDKIYGGAVRAIHDVSLVAANSQTDQALTALDFLHSTLTPAQMVEGYRYADSSYRLCWISGTSLEVAPITFVGNLQTQAITLYAKGLHSMASGILGVDESWTITALLTDADGVSY